MSKESRLKLIVGITAEPSVELLHGQLSFLKSKGYEVYLMAPSHERVTVFCRKEGVEHLQIDIERNISVRKDIRTLVQIVNIFRKIRPDIINLGTPKVSLLGMLAGRITGVPFRLYTCRGFRFEHERGKFRKFLIKLEKITASCAHKVFCISKSVMDLGVHEGIFKPDKCILIGKGSSNGIDLDIFDPSRINNERVLALRREYRLEGRFVFGFVGRIVDRKGILEMYKSFDKVYSQNSNARLLVVGKPFWDQVSDPGLIEKMNTHPGIIMAGVQKFEDVPYFMGLMDCFILPAWWEGFGNVLIQAAAMGLPIIATNVTGCKDAVSDGFNGVLVEKQNVDAFKDEMVNMMEDEENRLRLAGNGIKWSKNFEPRLIWEELHRIYQQH